jgi:hypothetical protein
MAIRFLFPVLGMLAAQTLFSVSAYTASLDGVWALSTAPLCEDEPLTDNWPLRINGKSWTGYESNCTADRAGEGRVTLSCAVEGDGEWTQTVSVTLSGDTLTVTEDGKTTTYTRCK